MAALMGVALKPIGELHSVTADIAMAWMVEAVGQDVVDRGSGNPPTRDGIVTFHIARVPANLVEVRVQMSRLMKIGDNETWIGKFVSCKAGDWSWSYPLDWRTGEKEQPQIYLGHYPFAHLDMRYLAR